MRLPVLAPLAAGVGLLALFVFLLWREAGRPEPPPPAPPAPPPVAKAAEPPPAPASDDRHPLDVPPEFKGLELSPPRGQGIERWNLEAGPIGWDAALATTISDFFSRMDISDPEDVEKMKELDRVREEFREFLKRLGPEAIPTLSTILNAEPDFVNRRFLLYALGDLGPRSEEATFALMDFYDRTQGRQGARSETNHIIEAMGRLKNDTAFQELNSRIDAETTSSYDRDKFIQALGDHPRRAESLPRFVAHGRDDPDHGTRNHSWQAVGKMGAEGRGALSDLIAAYERESLIHIRQTILGSIGKIGDPAALPFLERVARTGNDQERLSASRGIFLIGTPQARRVLASVAAGEREERIQKHIQKWLEGR